ncbi:hypothetical protein ACFFWD_06980 [Bradyrhizobium erythrophlei]|uniref:hypothetical protein n=1 Tax=Bradyrhizobium erythrophlei TaxID=1437360 RepID=UPI0035E8960A
MRVVLAALILSLSPAIAVADNAALAAKARAAFVAKKWPEAETVLKQLVPFVPVNWDLQEKLIAAQSAQGHYEDALESCNKAIGYARKGVGGMLPPGKDRAWLALGSLLRTQGDILLKLNKPDEAAKAYANADFNTCAMMYSKARMPEAVAACDKAIATDPAKADAYFIKGSALFREATVQDGKMVAPEASVQALQEYLALEPNGVHAADVKSKLGQVGQPTGTVYQTKK